MFPAPRTVELDDDLYPPEAVARTVEAYDGLCDATVTSGNSSRTLVIAPRQDAPNETVDEFLAYLLGAALDIHLRRLSKRL